MKLLPRRSVVPEVGEGTGVDIQVIWPVWFFSRGVQHRQPDRISGHASICAKSTLIAHRQQSRQRIIAYIPRDATTVDTFEEQVSVRQVSKLHTGGLVH
jgi:hypothetical protein